MLMLTVDRADRVPAYRQIYERIVRLVDGGALAPGDRLPPTRTMARILGVHRSTVLRAYGELWALGYLESRPGSYSTIRRRARPIPTDRPASVIKGEVKESTVTGTATADRPARTSNRRRSVIPSSDRRLDWESLRSTAEYPAPADAIDLARLTADPVLTPLDDIRSCFRSSLVRQGREVLDYGDAMGHLPLREAIARRMRSHGVDVSTEEILITNGAQQGLDLVLRLITRRGDGIAFESPTYSMALSLFKFHELRLREIPMRADGMDLAVLEQVLCRRQVKLVYTIPNFHNPTGISTGQAHRERILAACERHGTPVMEDGFEEEMKYFGMAVLPIKSMDTQGIVFYLGTLSKVVFPGLRIGWIAAPREAIDRLFAIQRITSLGGNMLTQAAVARFCSSGLYESHLRRVHKVYRKRMQALLRGLEAHMPKGVEWTQPLGGYTLWLILRDSPVDEGTLCDRLLGAGVKAAPGRIFFARSPSGVRFRLSIACVDEERILEGCRRLGQVLTAAARE